MLVLARWSVEGSSTDALSDGEITSLAALWFGHVAPADVLEVALIVLALWLIGHRLLRIPIAWLATVTVGLALVFLAITLVSLRETGALATWNALRTTGNWMGQDNRLLGVTARQGLLTAAGALWIAMPIAFAFLLGRLERAAPRLRWFAPGAVLAMVACPRSPAQTRSPCRRGQPDARPVVIGSHRAGAGRRSAATSRPAAERLAERLLPPRLSGRAARDGRVARHDRRVAATAASRPLCHPRNRTTRVLPVDRQRRAAHAALDEPARAGERSPCHRGAAN